MTRQCTRTRKRHQIRKRTEIEHVDEINMEHVNEIQNTKRKCDRTSKRTRKPIRERRCNLIGNSEGLIHKYC